LNGSEPTIDCGATCPKGCQIADTCVVAKDCASGKCSNQHCVPTAPSNTPLPTRGWIATASSTENSSTVAGFALDGDPTTWWTNGTGQLPGGWFEVDMGKPQVFFSITVTCLTHTSDFGESMELSGSLDGQTFTVLRTPIPGQTSVTISFVDPQYARYLKLKLLQSSNGLWWRIDDLTVLQ
jgi:hypothetical protein